ncbi:MAG TPA: ATP-binding cassette domain-containing protein [Symbiobacteriaceae bacterium]|nr:ATP-binding cassette domain-containing protein [Symbiobacteriaceae bacterium]
MIRIEGLSKTYKGGVKALQNLSLTIPAGLFGLLGPNGAGKTTLLRILATLLLPDGGQVEICGHDALRRPGDVRRQLGYLPQEFGTYPTLTMVEYLDYMAILAGIKSASDRRRRINQVLDMVRLQEKRKSITWSLSGGMKRRLGMAQALLADPRVLIVDEPTAGLDPEERVNLRNLLATLAQDRVVLLSTHIVEDVAQIAPALAVLKGGQVQYTGSVPGLLRRAEGRVWTAVVDDLTAAQLRTRHSVVGSVRTLEGHQVRLVAPEAPVDGASPATPTLEDAYVALMGGAMA